MPRCPCGSQAPTQDCCAPYLNGKAKPPTAEALMRARYTAYTQRNVEFVARTNDPKSKEPFDRAAAKNWAEKSQWLGLKVVRTEKGGKNDAMGKVEFIARFKLDGEEAEHHEVGVFRRDADTWYYVDGKTPGATVRHDAPTPGRNDLCPCGSGKKYKKCCGQ